MRQLLSFIIFLACTNVYAQDSLNMRSLFNWTTEGIPPSNAWDNVYNEVWGYAADNREYAIIGSTKGTHIIDVTIPGSSVEVDFVEGNHTGPSVVHRDYHTMDNFLFMVCAEGASKLQIADLSYLPDSVHVIYDSNDVLRGCHNIFIDTIQTRLYAVYTGYISSLVTKVIGISNPYEPVLLEILHVNEPVHDLYINDGIAYLNRGSDGMEIWDFTDLPGTQLGSITEYEGQGYNHSGYPTEDGNFYVMADETHGSPLKMIDVSDPSDLEVIVTMSSGVHELSIPHNQIIHEEKVYSTYYFDGLYIWSITDPSNPELLGFYDTSSIPHNDGYYGAWGVYPFLPSGNILVSDMQTGLWVLEYGESLGIDSEVNSESMKIWPNPCTDLLQVSGSDVKHAIYQIVNAQGQIVKEGMFEQNLVKLNFSDLDGGLYFIRVESNGKTSIKKFIKDYSNH